MPKTEPARSEHTPCQGPTDASLLVVIVSADDGRWLPRCLDSLRASRERDFSTLVVVNGCSDDTVEVVERCAPRRTFTATLPQMCSYADANNIGLQWAAEHGIPYVFLLNADTRVHPDALGELRAFAADNPGYGVIGSLQLSYDAEDWTTQNAWSRNALEQSASRGEHPRHVGRWTVLEQPYVQGAAMLVRLSLTRSIGQLDPVYGTFYEETDLCRRCRLAGSKVALLLDSRVKHFGGGNWSSSRERRIERDILYLRNQMLYHLSDEPNLIGSLGVAPVLVARQLRELSNRRYDTCLPTFQYWRVLWSLLGRLRYVRSLQRRNSAIASGLRLPPDEHRLGDVNPCAQQMSANPEFSAVAGRSTRRSSLPSVCQATGLTIAICTNRPHLAKESLAKALDATSQADSVLMILDAPECVDPEGLARDLRGGRAHVIVHGSRRRLSCSRNQALELCATPYILFIDDDVTLKRRTVEEIREAFTEGHEIVGVRIDGPESGLRLPWYITEGQLHYLGIHGSGTRKTWGACMGFSMRRIEREGVAFRADLGRRSGTLMSAEDTSFIGNLRARGAREVFLAGERVHHDIQPSRLDLRTMLRRAYWQGRSERARNNSLRGLRKELRRNWGSGGSRLRRASMTAVYLPWVLAGVLAESGSRILGTALERDLHD